MMHELGTTDLDEIRRRVGVLAEHVAYATRVINDTHPSDVRDSAAYLRGLRNALACITTGEVLT